MQPTAWIELTSHPINHITCSGICRVISWHSLTWSLIQRH